MYKYIATHGDKEKGMNPGLTEIGKTQIANLSIPDGIKMVVVGTGKRFVDMLSVLRNRLGDIPIKFSPLCGSADSGKKTETGFDVILADGETLVPIGDYIGLIGTPGLDLKTWVNSLPDGTLLLAGRELTGALGCENGEMGKLYCFDGSEVTLVS